MTTPTLDHPTVTPQTEPGHGGTDDDDGHAHKFRHDDIERSLRSGAVVTALCGYRARLTRPNQAGRPACPKCMDLVDLAESMEDWNA